MEETRLYDLENLIQFRRDLHRHPEMSFKEERTAQKILEYLAKLGIKENQIRRSAITGIIVDIYGQGKPSNKPLCVALRADMDAIGIKEENPSIDYQSENGSAHTCGHDMHMACLIGGTAKLLEKIDQIPSDKCIRLVFQPAEEDLLGAPLMVQEGAMEGVNEVYGMHNMPDAKPGEMLVQPGFMLGYCTEVVLTITGKGGHCNDVDQLRDPLQPAVDIHAGLRGLIKEYKQKGITFVFGLPFIRCSSSYSIIPDTCRLEGEFTSFDEEFTEEFKTRFTELANKSCEKFGCNVHVHLKTICPPVWNTDKETENVIRVAKKVLGEGKIRADGLPFKTTDDFAFFSKAVPGCYFFLTSAKNEQESLHTNCFDPHEDVLSIGAEMWYRLVEDRFELNFQ